MIRRIALGLIALAASLIGGCDGAVIDALPHPAPVADDAPACVLPAVGTTCPAPLEPLAALAFVQAAAWCPDGADLVADHRPGGDIELACAAVGWRIVVGVVAEAWGVAYLAPDGSLVVCDLEGRVDAVMPLLADQTSGRQWHMLSVDDGLCLDAGLCAAAFDTCAGNPLGDMPR